MGDRRGVGEVRLGEGGAVVGVEPDHSASRRPGRRRRAGSSVTMRPVDDLGLGPLLERPDDRLEPARVHRVVVVEIGDQLAAGGVDPGLRAAWARARRRAGRGPDRRARRRSPPRSRPRCASSTTSSSQSRRSVPSTDSIARRRWAARSRVARTTEISGELRRVACSIQAIIGAIASSALAAAASRAPLPGELATSASTPLQAQLALGAAASGAPSRLIARDRVEQRAIGARHGISRRSRVDRPGAAGARTTLPEVMLEPTLNRPCGGRYGNVIEAVGNTPLVELPRLSPKPGVRIFAKLEGRNPTGSVKDRVAKAMIEAAEDQGAIAPGQTILEPTSGNTGISLAMICRRKGYPVKVVMPDNVTEERTQLLRMFGAEIVYSEGAKGSNGAVELALEMAEADASLLHALPVRQRGQSRRPLPRHRGRDPRRARPGERRSSPGSAPAAR